jgi:hypothetical protein
MRRDLYRGLLGGIDSALAWGLAEKTAREARHLHTRQLKHAIEAWEDEGGALSLATGGDARRDSLDSTSTFAR